jgi:4'-phosphopantetheinyl transferase EntD
VLASLVPPTVAVVEGGPADPEQALFAEELIVVRHATAARRREFAAGRACAHAALQQLGCRVMPIPADGSRAPIWPDGVMGSITHCAGFTAAAVARRADLTMLGIDAEPAGPLDAEVAAHVVDDAELERASDELGVDAGVVLFSAKEAVYKAWYPITRRWLDFDAVTLSVERSGAFTVQTRRGLPKSDRELLSALRGRFATTSEHVFTTAYG